MRKKGVAQKSKFSIAESADIFFGVSRDLLEPTGSGIRKITISFSEAKFWQCMPGLYTKNFTLIYLLNLFMIQTNCALYELKYCIIPEYFYPCYISYIYMLYHIPCRLNCGM